MFQKLKIIYTFPLQIDREGQIWVLSDRLPSFMYSHLNPDDYNFRILKGSVREAIKNTACSMERPLPATNKSREPSSEGNVNSLTMSQTSGCIKHSAFIYVLLPIVLFFV